MVADHPEILQGSANKYQNWKVTDPERLSSLRERQTTLILSSASSAQKMIHTASVLR
jgi:hypothetical protein